MKHIYALLIKFVMITIICGIVLGTLTPLTFGDILYISAAVTILAYIIGDLLILSATNNIVATISDFVLALVVIYLFNFLWTTNMISFGDAFITSLIIGVGEWFFHKFVSNKVFPNTPKEGNDA
ncbi:DUF2512 family protein [Anaerocolumna sedimenticola]|uniref:DUF2512 family protein n=1 Tax=Anaerocolumna sedimenticola TaxID=2696063 RepID=A0A6P1TPY4_9FIRM|nr:DUF2512 family protein [Anaerocolumna sedimenticola]QHQ61675.1 DUF2512 family protein [Anaerocolumna sedimenticola]